MTKSNVVPIVFLAFANDRDDRTRYLRNLAKEARQLKKTLSVAEQHGHCQVIVEQNVTSDVILDMFQDTRYRDRIAIFHFGGHADGYRLLLETAEGKPAAIDAGGLAAFLAQQRGLQLVFLNGCSTEGQVIDLLDAGVHAVIATDQAVEDVMATAFAARFYQGLAGGAAIGTAFEQAKAAMRMQGGVVFRHLGAADEEQADAGRIPWRLHDRAGAEAVAGWNLPQAARDPLFGLPPLPPLDLPDRPYRYLDWYRREDAEVFFGRGREIRDLYDRITAPASPPIVLFYGQSGVGKSSLLAAGLLPRLESSHETRYVRRDQTKGLLGTLTATLQAVPGDNLASAWHCFEAQAGRPSIVVLDQVEEVFTRPNPEQPDEIAVFLDAVESLFADTNRRPRGRLVLGFRKEWLAEIEKRLAERTLPRSKVFLERLNGDGIAEVVAGPTSAWRLQDQYGLQVAPELPETIAGDLLEDAGSSVAPTLQILLTKMWERAKSPDHNHPSFDLMLYREMKREGLLLKHFLDQQLRSLYDDQRASIESGLVLDVLAFHTTPLSTAEQRSQAELYDEYRHQETVLSDLIRHCQQLYLLVDSAENQPDKPPSTRLIHDTLAPLVRARFDESDAPGQRARRILESRAIDWRAGKHDAPLDETDLALVEAGHAGMRVWQPEEESIVDLSRQRRQLAVEERQRIELEREMARKREIEHAREIARQSAARSRQQAWIIRILSVILGFVLLWGGLRFYRDQFFRWSAWESLAGANFPRESVAYAMISKSLMGDPPGYLYCVATWMVGVGCSRNGATWDFYQQGLPTGKSAPRSIGGFSGNGIGITALAFDADNPGVLHAFLLDQHFYRTSNVSSIDGQTWISSTFTIPVGTEVSTLAAQDQLVLAVAHKNQTSGDERLYVSTDGGQNWQLEVGPDDARIGRVYDAAIDREDGTIVAATSKGIWRGRRQGTSWTWRSEGLSTDSRLLASVPGNNRAWVIVTYDPTERRSALWFGSTNDLQFVAGWDGEPMRLTLDPRFAQLSEPVVPLAYVLLTDGDVVKVETAGQTYRLQGISHPIFGDSFSIAAVPRPDRKGVWLLLGHRKGVFRHKTEK